jgi:hypothetical protein
VRKAGTDYANVAQMNFAAVAQKNCGTLSVASHSIYN